MRFLRSLKNFNHRHLICLGFLVSTAAWIFYCCQNSITRFLEAGRDLGFSFVYALFFTEEWCPAPTFINDSAVTITSLFPKTLEAFFAEAKIYFGYFFNRVNLKLFWVWLSPKIQFYSRIILLGAVVVLCYVLLKKFVFRPKVTTKYKVSFFKKVYLKLELKIWYPFKKYIYDLVIFFLERKKYHTPFLLMFLFGSNVFTILMTFFAWYFYFCGSFSWGSIFLYVHKLTVDVIILLGTLPLWLWLVIGAFVFDKVTRYQAVKRLVRQEEHNEDFVRSLGLVVFVIGLMRSGKTKLISSMQKTQARAFRYDALEIMLEVHSHFPHFPFEQYIKYLHTLIEERKIRGLGFCEAYVRILKRKFDESNGDKVLLFGYDYKRYGLNFDNGCVIISLFKELSDFAQAYLIYTEPTLMFGNYAMREDDLEVGYGNLEAWDTEIFTRKSFNGNGVYSHVLDYDAFRPGRKMNPEGKSFGSVEYGVGGIAEVDKERENTAELQEVKKESKECNQKNDLFNLHLKMMGHAASVHFKTFVKLFTDSQRETSWGADGRELSELVKITETSDLKLALRFCGFRWMIYDWLKSFHDGKVYSRWVHRADTTLRSYLFDKFICWYLQYFERIINAYGYVKQTLVRAETSGNDDQTEHVWFQANKKVHSGLYETASFSAYYRKHNKRANIAFRDLPRYKNGMPDLHELEDLSKSHFIKKINKF